MNCRTFILATAVLLASCKPAAWDEPYILPVTASDIQAAKRDFAEGDYYYWEIHSLYSTKGDFLDGEIWLLRGVVAGQLTCTMTYVERILTAYRISDTDSEREKLLREAKSKYRGVDQNPYFRDVYERKAWNSLGEEIAALERPTK